MASLADIQFSTDSSTHFVRMIHARDLYLPSGHHWGWEPFWFQGYVPFLLYPHLTYVALAIAELKAWLQRRRERKAKKATVKRAKKQVKKRRKKRKKSKK